MSKCYLICKIYKRNKTANCRNVGETIKSIIQYSDKSNLLLIP